MSNPRTWLPRAQEILATLGKMNTPTLDRTAVEQLFLLQKRTALQLMKLVGPLSSGQSFLVERKALIKWVKQIDATEGRAQELRRRTTRQIVDQLAEYQSTKQALTQAGRPPVTFTLPQEVMNASIAALPPAIKIEAGLVSIQFDRNDPQSLCQLLYELGIALANDYDGFLNCMIVYK